MATRITTARPLINELCGGRSLCVRETGQERGREGKPVNTEMCLLVCSEDVHVHICV